MWLTDVDHNRLVKADMNGQPVLRIYDPGRPMHITVQDGKVYIPEFYIFRVIYSYEKQAIFYAPDHARIGAHT